MAFDYIGLTLNQRRQDSLLRRRICFDKVGSARLIYNGREYLNFSSNDYLGLSESANIRDPEAQLGSTSSSLVTGYQASHLALETYLCEQLGFDACILFNSGFSANSSLLKSLMNQPDSEIFQDKLNHASLIDGGLQAKAQNTRFNHNNMQHLATKLERSKATNKLIVSEGIFSMDGDRAPLSELNRLAAKHHAWLMIDDAHSFGVDGDNGLGTCETIKPQLLVVTFGKAVASSGAAVLCSSSVKDYLLQFDRDYIYSTAMSPLLASYTLQQLKRVANASTERQILKDNIAYFKTRAQQAGISMMESHTAIQPIVIGDSESTLAICERLKEQHIWAIAIRPPTVAHNTARIRITLTASHSRADIDMLISALKQAM